VVSGRWSVKRLSDAMVSGGLRVEGVCAIESFPIPSRSLSVFDYFVIRVAFTKTRGLFAIT
jgi:hypothetical protein